MFSTSEREVYCTHCLDVCDRYFSDGKDIFSAEAPFSNVRAAPIMLEALVKGVSVSRLSIRFHLLIGLFIDNHGIPLNSE